MKNLLKILTVGLLLVPFSMNSFSRPQTSPRFVAFDGARGSVVQNKRYIVPYILATREARQLGDVPNSILQEPQTHWNGYIWQNNAGDLLFENIADYGDWLWASNLYRNGDTLAERPGKYTWRNIFIAPTEGYTSMKFGTREYNAPQREFYDCDFYAIPVEHGIYVSNYEGTVVDNCTFVRIGSQGVQFTHRADPYQQYGADNRPYSEKPLHILKDSHFIDCAQGGARPSYNASYFNPGSPEFPGTLLIENCSFVCKWIEPEGYFQNYSTGALVVSPMQGNDPLVSNFMELVQVKNCLFDFTKGDRNLINIRSTDTVIFEDCCFIARDHMQPFVDIDLPNEYTADSKTQRIILRNCVSVGDVKLRVWRRDPVFFEYDFVEFDLNTYGEEVIIDGITGEIISSGPYN